MAKKENQPEVDRDSSYDYRNPKSAPEAERETAYHDNLNDRDEKEDPYKNEKETRVGREKDKSRIADKKKVEESIFDRVLANRFRNLEETSHTLKKLSGGKHQSKVHKKTKKYANEEVENEEPILEYSPYAATSPGTGTYGSVRLFGAKPDDTRATTIVPRRRTPRLFKHPQHSQDKLNSAANLRRRLGRRGLSEENYLPEAENPGVAASPVTSDNPTLGMYAMNGVNNASNQITSVKPMLETIALQAAESFEALDDNAAVPDFFSSELNQCVKVLNRIYNYITNEQKLNPAQDGSPVSGQNFMTKESYLNEAMYHATGYVYPHGEPEKGKEYAVPVSKEEIDGMYDPTGNKFLRKVKKHNPHLTHDEAKAIADSRGDELNKDHPTHTVENDREYKRIYENNDLEEELVGDQHKLDVSGPEGKPDKRLSHHDFETLRLRQDAKAKKKLEEAMFDVFAYLVREGKFD